MKKIHIIDSWELRAQCTQAYFEEAWIWCEIINPRYIEVNYAEDVVYLLNIDWFEEALKHTKNLQWKHVFFKYMHVRLIGRNVLRLWTFLNIKKNYMKKLHNKTLIW